MTVSSKYKDGEDINTNDFWSPDIITCLFDSIEYVLESEDLSDVWSKISNNFLEKNPSAPYVIDENEIEMKFAEMKRAYYQKIDSLNPIALLELNWPYLDRFAEVLAKYTAQIWSDDNDDNSSDIFEVLEIIEDDLSEEPTDPMELSTIDINDDEDDGGDNAAATEDDDDECVVTGVEYIDTLQIHDRNLKKCRVCFKDLDIFKKFSDKITTSAGETISIEEAFINTTSINFDYRFGKICLACFRSLKFVYDFIDEVRQTHEKFMELRNAAATAINNLEDTNNHYHQAQGTSKDFVERNTLKRSVDHQSQIDISQDIETGNKKNREKRRKEGDNECFKCTANFDNKSSLEQHLKEEHGFEMYRCLKCLSVFETYSPLEAHMLTHTSQSDFECNICLLSIASQEELTVHMKTHSQEKEGCEVSSDSFSYKSTWKSRIKKNPLKKFKCNFCDEAFTTSDKLMKHRSTVHPTVKCKYCDLYETESYHHLRKHEMDHFKLEYECEICQLQYNVKDGFTEHLLLVHQESMSEDDLMKMRIRNRDDSRRLEREHLKNGGGMVQITLNSGKPPTIYQDHGNATLNMKSEPELQIESVDEWDKEDIVHTVKFPHDIEQEDDTLMAAATGCETEQATTTKENYTDFISN